MWINKVPYYVLRSLIFTVIIEVVVALIIGIRKKKDITNVVLVNLITNPFVTLIPITLNIYVSLDARNISLIILEIIVLFTEALIYKFVLEYKKLHWFLVSLILNLSSFGIGEIINKFL